VVVESKPEEMIFTLHTKSKELSGMKMEITDMKN
jgi:hypothetical protein